MDIEFKHKYKFNPGSHRLDNYDYSSNGGYFITICTNERYEYFGEIINGEMILNEYGKIVFNDLKNIETHYDYIILDEFVIMPNHIHFIIIINFKDSGRDVSVKHLNDDIKFTKQYYSNISPSKGSLGNIIKLFKGFVSKKINKLNQDPYFAWQANYHDKIIRNDEQLNKAREYIINNPLKWELDVNNPQNIEI